MAISSILNPILNPIEYIINLIPGSATYAGHAFISALVAKEIGGSSWLSSLLMTILVAWGGQIIFPLSGQAGMPFFGDSMMILLTFAAVYAVNYAPSFIREPLNHRYVKMFFKIGQGLFLASLIVNAASNVSAADKTALEIDAETKFLKKLWLRIEHFLQGLDLSSYLLSMMVSSCAVWGGMVLAYVAANKSLYTDSPVDTAIIYRVLVDNLVCTLLIKFGILTAGHAGILIKGYFTLSHVATELPFEVPQLEEKAAQAVHLLTGIPALAKKKSD